MTITGASASAPLASARAKSNVICCGWRDHRSVPQCLRRPRQCPLPSAPVLQCPLQLQPCFLGLFWPSRRVRCASRSRSNPGELDGCGSFSFGSWLLLFPVSAVTFGTDSFLDPFTYFLPARPMLLPISLPAASGLPSFISWPNSAPPFPTSWPAPLKLPPTDSGPTPSLPAVSVSRCPVTCRFSAF